MPLPLYTSRRSARRQPWPCRAGGGRRVRLTTVDPLVRFLAPGMPIVRSSPAEGGTFAVRSPEQPGRRPKGGEAP
jgi:hypothetical protein